MDFLTELVNGCWPRARGTKKVGDFREKVPNFCAKVERFCVKVAEKKQKRRTFPRKRAALSLVSVPFGGKMCAAQGTKWGDQKV